MSSNENGKKPNHCPEVSFWRRSKMGSLNHNQSSSKAGMETSSLLEQRQKNGNGEALLVAYRSQPGRCGFGRTARGAETDLMRRPSCASCVRARASLPAIYHSGQL